MFTFKFIVDKVGEYNLDIYKDNNIFKSIYKISLERLKEELGEYTFRNLTK